MKHAGVIACLLILIVVLTGCAAEDRFGQLKPELDQASIDVVVVDSDDVSVAEVEENLTGLPDQQVIVEDLEQVLKAGETGSTEIETKVFWHIKNFSVDISDEDLDRIKDLGFQVLVPGWGVGSAGWDAVQDLLDRLQERELKVVLDGGFSSQALGFRDDGSDPIDQRPVWQKDLVSAWISQFKNHPAVYGWDISNEAGENVPNGDRFRVSLDQLKDISAAVRELDPSHPILMRMHHWEEYYYEDGDFGWDNPFDRDIADIVMLNLYSNYSEDGVSPLIPDMVDDSVEELVDKIFGVDDGVRIWVSMAAFREEPMFLRPSASDLARDIEAVQDTVGIESIGFFSWGDEEDDWYLLRDGQDLVEVMENHLTI